MKRFIPFGLLCLVVGFLAGYAINQRTSVAAQAPPEADDRRDERRRRGRSRAHTFGSRHFIRLKHPSR